MSELRARGAYRGQRENGVPHGRGVFVYRDGLPMLNYTGEWSFGRKSGTGAMFWRSGDSYRGDFFDDVPHGRGEYVWAAGHRYVGNYRCDTNTLS